MAIDGVFFKRLTKLCNNEVNDFKISKINCLNDFCFLFNLWKNGSIKYFLISATPGNSYFNVLTSFGSDFKDFTHFGNLLKMHLLNGRITTLETINNDRILQINIATFNEIHDEVNYHLYLEIIGKFSNLILCKENNIIIDAAKRLPPDEHNDRIILPGFTYTPPLNIVKHPIEDTYEGVEYSKYYYGISTLLEKEINYRINYNNQSFNEIIDIINQSNSIYFTNTDRKDFHFLPLLHLSDKYEVYPWQEALQLFYLNKTIEDSKKIMKKNTINLCKTYLERAQKKIIKLKDEIVSLDIIYKYRKFGELLFTYPQEEIVNNCVILIDEGITYHIPIDSGLSLIENGKLYFQKYEKANNAKPFIEQQIDKTKEEILYFESLLSSLEYSDASSLMEIQEELSKNGYLKSNEKKNKKKQPKKYLPKTFYTKEKVKISVGMNHLQNEYLTFTLAKYNEFFFHVKDYPGSHVVVHTQELNEATIRYAANLAAFYSKARYSSSVPIDYTLMKNVKKYPGNNQGLVILKNYKTIFIDPEEPTCK